MTYLWNHPEQDRPIGSQGVYPDHLGFVMAPTLLVAALLHSRRSGKGVSIDLAQIEGTAYTLGVTYLEAALNGTDPQPKGNRDPLRRHTAVIAARVMIAGVSYRSEAKMNGQISAGSSANSSW